MKRHHFWKSVCGAILFTCVLLRTVYAQVEEEWVRRYDGPSSLADGAVAIGTDADGNITVTGTSEGNGTSEDYATIRYDSEGNVLWEARYDGPGGGSDIAAALALDRDGNMFVTGQCYISSTAYATLKYAPDGRLLWVKYYDYDTSAGDEGIALAVDDSGRVYVTGMSAHSYPHSMATICYDPSGRKLWTNRYSGSGSAHGIAIAVDSEQDAIGIGSTSGSIVMIKYASDGTRVWETQSNYPAGSNANPSTIAVDAERNIYVTGKGNGDLTGSDYVTIKYSSDGSELWAARYNGPDSLDDEAIDIALDGATVTSM